MGQRVPSWFHVRSMYSFYRVFSCLCWRRRTRHRPDRSCVRTNIFKQKTTRDRAARWTRVRPRVSRTATTHGPRTKPNNVSESVGSDDDTWTIRRDTLPKSVSDDRTRRVPEVRRTGRSRVLYLDRVLTGERHARPVVSVVRFRMRNAAITWYALRLPRRHHVRACQEVHLLSGSDNDGRGGRAWNFAGFLRETFTGRGGTGHVTEKERSPSACIP